MTFLSKILSLGFLLFLPVSVWSKTFTVSPGGSDQAEGSTTNPFATLERARAAARETLKKGEPVEVILRAGTYELSSTFELGSEDSGSAENPVVWRAADGEEVRLSGGRAVQGWKKVSDPVILAKLSEPVRNQILEISLKELGITDYGEMRGGFGKEGSPGMEVFVHDSPMHVARYPNQGFINITKVLGSTVQDIRGTLGTREGIFQVSDPRVAAWANEKDARVFGYWFWDWADDRQKIAAIDPSTLTLTLTQPWHEYGYRNGQYFYAYNLLSEIDEPGEWMLDRNAGTLYLLPPGEKTPERTVVSILPSIITLQGASHITFRNLILEAARGYALVANDCQNIRLSDSLLRNCGKWGVHISGGSQCSVSRCEITGMGEGGVSLAGGDRKTLLSSGHRVDNCNIHDYSRWSRTYQPAIRLEGVGCSASHNLIHDAPHQAIAFGGNDHQIEFNEIYRVCEESNDAGAIYAWNDWAGRGHEIRFNYLHDIRGKDGKGARGVYLDDGFSAALIYGNIFKSVAGAVLLGGGRDIQLVNNLFVDCPQAMEIDARGLDWRAYGFEELKNKLELWPYQTSPWSERYPELPNILKENPMTPKGTTVKQNVLVSCGKNQIHENAKPWLTIENNLFEAKTEVLVPDNKKIPAINESDPDLLKIGFKPIPWPQIGLSPTGQK